MKKHKTALLTLCLALLAFPAWALDLHTARKNGQIGEKTDGYVEALASGAEVVALAKEVNAKRQQEYGRIAASKGQSPEIVAKLAAEQIISGLEPGSMYQSSGGGWKKR